MKTRLVEHLLRRYLLAAKGRDRRVTDLSLLDPEQVKSVLLISSTAIGDTLMSTPVFAAVRRRWPQARITGYLNAKNMDLFRHDPSLDRILAHRRGWLRFARAVHAMRKERPDVAMVLHGNDPHAMPAAYLSGARFIVQAHRSRRFGFLVSPGGDLTDPPLHSIHRRLAAAGLAGCPADDTAMRLIVDRGAARRAEDLITRKGWRGRTLIGLQIGANDAYKTWPADRFAELGQRLLADRPGAVILLTGSAAESRLCRRTAEAIGAGAHSLAGRLPLPDTAALLSRFSLLVTNDTGTMHMAFALGVPTVALFGPTDPNGLGPLTQPERHRIVAVAPPCDPCQGKSCRDPFCMAGIEVETVFVAAGEVLDAAGRG